MTFKPINDGQSTTAKKHYKKETRAVYEEESSKKRQQKEDNDAEKEELRDSIDVVPRDDVTIDVESLMKFKNYQDIAVRMLDDFDKQDVIDLHRLVNERYEITSPEGYDLLL
ncbi:hypothetical protein Tco_0444779 [Tanacetum coccineum]